MDSPKTSDFVLSALKLRLKYFNRYMCFLRSVFSIQVTNFVFHCPFINVWKIKTIQMTSTWNSWTLNHITAFHICLRNPKWKTLFFVQCWYFLFPERSGLTVCQFFLLSVVFFFSFLVFCVLKQRGSIISLLLQSQSSRNALQKSCS